MQKVKTSLLQGGLDVVTPPIVMPPGRAISSINYEPDINGYTRIGGFERFDGRDRPSDSTVPATIAARRAAIAVVPGSGPVRGVHIFSGDVYAFRDTADASAGAMYRATSSGWSLIELGGFISFGAGTAEFFAGDFIGGGTSGASAVVQRVGHLEGAWSGSAAGILVISDIVGTFIAGEIITGTGGGSATVSVAYTANTLSPGGKYEFDNHNYYGAAQQPRMYFVNSVDTGYEYGGGFWVAPIQTGIESSMADELLLAANGDFILAANGDSIALSAGFDAPAYIAHYKNHLFLGFTAGALVHSSIGEPLQFITTTGAGEIPFGDTMTGLLGAAATSLMAFGTNRMEYLTGDDQDNFVLNPISETTGAKAYTVQMLDSPTFLDDGGVRRAPTTAAFGDWRMGTLTGLVEPMIIKKRDDNVEPVASLKVKAKDQYKVFWEDGTGMTVYVGRKNPEAMPFKLPIDVFCACSGEVEAGLGDRLFVGCQDGYVYELNRGTSFDGANINAYLRLPFTFANSPNQNVRWMKVTFEMQTPDPIEVGVAFDLDYGHGLSGTEVDVDVLAGSPTIDTDDYASIAWTPVQGRLEYHLSGIGPNIAATDNKLGR